MKQRTVLSPTGRMVGTCLGILLVVAASLALRYYHSPTPPLVHTPTKSPQGIAASPTPTQANSIHSLAPLPTAIPTRAPTPSPRPSPTAPLPSRFNLLPPGSPLPSEADCAARVRRSAWEPRPNNYTANHTVPTAQQLAGLDPQQNRFASQITGNFTGTTDEILQWTACKWGMDEDIVRAQAVVESWWNQSNRGGATTDQTLCPPNTWDGKQCYQYFGLLQLTYIYAKAAWPMMRDDTAFNVEYVYALIYACYDGLDTFTNTPAPGYPSYHAGDIWGCIGSWYSGKWYTQDSLWYISSVKTDLANKTWLWRYF